MSMSILRLEEISFAYRRGGDVLDGLRLQFDAGRTVLLGPNGAGKSTLLALAADALSPRAGRVVLESVGSPGSARHDARTARAWRGSPADHPFPGSPSASTSRTPGG